MLELLSGRGVEYRGVSRGVLGPELEAVVLTAGVEKEANKPTKKKHKTQNMRENLK